MERMRVKVDSVGAEDGLVVARVVSLSDRKIVGRPVARITLEVTLRVAEDESKVGLRRRARDKALEFLDVS
jgi:hypothetical protein